MSRRRRSPHTSPRAPTSHDPWPSSRVQSLPQHFGSSPNPVAQRGRRRTCPHLSLPKDTSPQFPPSSPPPSRNHGHLNAFLSPGVPFPERGFEQRRDVRPLDVQIRRSAFRHLLPLAVAEAAATAAARPRALWEWRPAAPPSRRVETKRDVMGGGHLRTRVGPGGGRSALPRSAAPHRPPPVQHLVLASGGPGPPGFNSSLWGPVSSLSLERCHRPVHPRLLPSPPSFSQTAGNPYLRIHSRWRVGWGGGRGDSQDTAENFSQF